MTELVSGCKANLGLRIRGLRPDGFHLLDSLFYPLPYPRDHIVISPGEKPGISLSITENLPANSDNILFAAYNSYAVATSFKPHLKIHLKKRVPVGAGLGGGSANAAVFLNWLNRIAPVPLPRGQLLDIAASVGSDVPFFLYSRPCAVSGRGEIIRPVRFTGSGYYLVIIYPEISLSTRQIFKTWDTLHNQEYDLTITDCTANNSDSILDIRTNVSLTNDLETAAYALYPQLQILKDQFLNSGAEQAAMSGSGSAHYGIFSDPEKAVMAARSFRASGMKTYWLPMQDFGA